MRALRILPLLLLLPACALHGTAPLVRDQWEPVTTVPPGSLVRVWWWDSVGGRSRDARDRGILAKADASEVTILTKTGEIRLPRTQVRRIDVVIGGGDSIKNGAIIGAIAGGGYAAFILYALGGELEDGSAYIIAPLMLGGIGAAIGAVVDALIRGDETRTVYQASRQ